MHRNCVGRRDAFRIGRSAVISGSGRRRARCVAISKGEPGREDPIAGLASDIAGPTSDGLG